MQRKVFISYSWDDEKHQRWVLDLASKLTAAGVEVILDRWDLKPGESVTHFMEKSVRETDCVLAILTPAFATKADARTGGVGYEQQVISGALLNGLPRSKLIPVLRAGSIKGEGRAVPTMLDGTVFIDFRRDEELPASTEELLRAIYQVPLHARPPLGQAPPFVLPSVVVQKPRTNLLKIDADGRISPVQCELLAHEIMKARKNSAGLTRFEADIDGYSELKRSLSTDSLADEERLAKVTALHRAERYGLDWDDAISEAVRLAVTHVAGHSLIAATPSDLSKVLAATIAALTHYPEIDHLTKFDMFHRSGEWYFGFRVSPQERLELEERERNDVSVMVSGYGLKWHHFPSDIVAQRIVPLWIMEFLRLRNTSKTAIDESEYFAIEHWDVGLG